MSKLLETYLKNVPEPVRSEIKLLQEDSEMLQNLCVADPGDEVEIMRRLGQAFVLLAGSETISGLHKRVLVVDRLAHFVDRMGMTFAYCIERFASPTSH